MEAVLQPADAYPGAAGDVGDGALRDFHEAVKDALDPNSIMAPGKSGIWGRKYRGQDL